MCPISVVSCLWKWNQPDEDCYQPSSAGSLSFVTGPSFLAPSYLVFLLFLSREYYSSQNCKYSMCWAMRRLTHVCLSFEGGKRHPVFCYQFCCANSAGPCTCFLNASHHVHGPAAAVMSFSEGSLLGKGYSREGCSCFFLPPSST